jgi:hypothetical protein
MTPDIITKIARATDRNDHWLAAIIIANEYGSKCEQDILSLYSYRAHQRGYGDSAEMSVRDNIVKSLMTNIAHGHGVEVANAILEAP